jgi:subfamily B ATP-binding cassette protein MsbA
MLKIIRFHFYKLLKLTRIWRENHLIIRELKHFRRIVATALVFTLLSAIFQGLGVGFILTFLQSLTEPDLAPARTGFDWFDTHILGTDLSATARVYRVSGVLLITTLLQAAFTGVGVAYSGRAQSQLVLRLKKRIFDQLQALNLSYFTKIRSGNLINGVTTEISELKNVFETTSFIIVRISILAVYVVSMLLISWQLTAVIIVLFALISIFISKLLTFIREASFEMSKARNLYTSVAIEFVSGIRTIQASAAHSFEQSRLDDSAFQVFEAENKTWKMRAFVETVPETAITLLTISILLFSFSVLIPNGSLRVSSLLTFLFIIIRTLPLVRQLNSARGRISRYQGAVESTKDLLTTERKSFFKNGHLEFKGLRNTIELEFVDFSYEFGDPVLQDINLSIRRGEMTALVGASGAGKTTLADLIPRFYDPTNGRILIDGVDIKEFEINSLRRRMAVVSQDTFIFNTSARENIAYALENIDDSKILRAAEMANALRFIERLPQGLDTQLGDRGVLLSGGQRQRIAIARALLRDPDILILDEATSALDSVSEKLIQESIEELSKGRTVIAIAHRLSTITRADKVVVLEKGRIFEQGNYQVLLSKQGKLWEYHQIQHEDVNKVTSR